MFAVSTPVDARLNSCHGKLDGWGEKVNGSCTCGEPVVCAQAVEQGHYGCGAYHSALVILLQTHGILYIICVADNPLCCTGVR